MDIPCKTHELRILSKWFEDVQAGRKNFEIRRYDRDFKEGDYLLLKEWDEGKYTGRELTRKIQYIYDGPYGLSDGYCILGIYEEQPTGEWETFEKCGVLHFLCRKCHHAYTVKYNFCPHCGEKKRGGKSNE